MSLRSFALGTLFGALMALTLAAATTVVASVDEKRLEAARELIGAAIKIKEFERIVAEVVKGFSTEIMAEAKGRSERDVVNAMMREARTAISDNREVYLEGIAQIYAAHLSVKDLEAATEFFSSSAGKRWTKAQDAILEDTVDYAGAKGGELRERIIAETLEALRRQGYTRN
jgi:hypothetical protein